MPRYDGSNSTIERLLKKFGIDPKRGNIRLWDIKTNYKEAVLRHDQFCHTIMSVSPDEVSRYGLAPSRRGEVNFKSIGGVTDGFFFAALGAHQFKFIFAFPCRNATDHKTSPALEVLGWLDPPKKKDGKPDPNGTAWMYVFNAKQGTSYTSANGTVSKSSEIMFPTLIAAEDITATYKITWPGGKATFAKIADPVVHDWTKVGPEVFG